MTATTWDGIQTASQGLVSQYGRSFAVRPGTVRREAAEPTTLENHRMLSRARAIDPAHHGELVRELLAADDVDVHDSLVAQIQKKLRYGDYTLAHQLDTVARGQADKQFGIDGRTTALEALAGAKSPVLEPMVCNLLLVLCNDPDDQVKLAAIACATHLSPGGKHLVTPTIQLLVQVGSLRIRAAGRAFLSTVTKSY